MAREDLVLSIEALAALVNDAFPALPPAWLARGLDTYEQSFLSAARYQALELVESLLLGRVVAGDGSREHAL